MQDFIDIAAISAATALCGAVGTHLTLFGLIKGKWAAAAAFFGAEVAALFIAAYSLYAAYNDANNANAALGQNFSAAITRNPANAPLP